MVHCFQYRKRVRKQINVLLVLYSVTRGLFSAKQGVIPPTYQATSTGKHKRSFKYLFSGTYQGINNLIL